MKIEIGGGNLCPEGFINLDPVHGEGPWKRTAQGTKFTSLGQPIEWWPTEDNTVDEIGASHVMEHIPAGAERIFVLNEAFRVLKPGCPFNIIVPVLKTKGGFVSWEAIADPTHVSYWCYESFLYLVENGWAANADYGLKLWKSDSCDSYEERGAIAYCTLVKP